jgi:hypothetical protein
MKTNNFRSRFTIASEINFKPNNKLLFTKIFFNIFTTFLSVYPIYEFIINDSHFFSLFYPFLIHTILFIVNNLTDTIFLLILYKKIHNRNYLDKNNYNTEFNEFKNNSIICYIIKLVILISNAGMIFTAIFMLKNYIDYNAQNLFVIYLSIIYILLIIRSILFLIYLIAILLFNLPKL